MILPSEFGELVAAAEVSALRAASVTVGPATDPPLATVAKKR